MWVDALARLFVIPVWTIRLPNLKWYLEVSRVMILTLYVRCGSGECDRPGRAGSRHRLK